MGVTLKSKKTNSYPVRISYIAIIHQLVLAQQYVAWQMHVQTILSLAYLQDLITTLAGVFVILIIPTKVVIKACRCARECIICTCIWLHMAKPTVANAGWRMIAIAVSNWVATYFLTFYCNPYILFKYKSILFVYFL